MIDEKILVERLEEEKENNPCRHIQCKDCKYTKQCYEGLQSHKVGMDNVISIVNQLAEEQNNGWIPCSERLPETRDWCLTVFKEGDSDFVVVPRVAKYMGKETVCTTNEGWLIIGLEIEIGTNAYYKKLECIAWQPLPAPYQPNKKGED